MDERLTTILDLFRARGDSNYGKEAVTQRQHALQAAMFAERAKAPPALVVAALLHDVGHLLHDLPEDAPDTGVDDQHEERAAEWLRQHFGDEVVEPVRLHVAAKRYLCAADPAYFARLSALSLQSLKLQGGPMSGEEQAAFKAGPHFDGAVRLRRWDEAAKVPELATPDLEHFVPLVERALVPQVPD